MYPLVNYRFLLKELSINKLFPCEIIRELVSNAYDANAKNIDIYPLPQFKGFIFIDDGIGLSEDCLPGDLASAYVAFFSIGVSTKIEGDLIGYKGHGTKLCFASGKFGLVTKNRSEPNFRTLILDNPKDNLSDNLPIDPIRTAEPWNVIKSMLRSPNEHTIHVLRHLNERFFRNFKQGTVIIILDYELDDFDKFFNPSETNVLQHYLATYIRSATKHGDPRDTKPTQTGFSPTIQRSLDHSLNFKKGVKLSIFIKGRFHSIESGFFWINKPTSNLANIVPMAPRRLRSGRFWERHSKYFEYNGKKYSFILAIDGCARALDELPFLNRRGAHGERSGIKIEANRGLLVYSHGVRICQYSEIFSHPLLTDRYGELDTDAGKSHYTFVIDGPFDLMSNRNDIVGDRNNVFRDNPFILMIKEFLDKLFEKETVFFSLVERLNHAVEDARLDQETEASDELMASVKNRLQYTFLDIPILDKKIIFEPLPAEEHGVGALYMMLCHFVTPDLPFSNYWNRAITFSAQGIDSLAVNRKESFAQTDLLSIEYKFEFDCCDIFNHSFRLTDYIICWKISPVDNGTIVNDKHRWGGRVALKPELEDFGIQIIDITDLDSHVIPDKRIVVISLEKLMKKTFKVKTIAPAVRTTAPRSATAPSRGARASAPRRAGRPRRP